MYEKMIEDHIEKHLKKNNLKSKNTDENFELAISSLILNDYNYNSTKIKNGIVDGGRDEGFDSIYILVNGEIVDNVDMFKGKINTCTNIKFIFIQTKISKKFEEVALKNIYDGLLLITKENVDFFENKKLRNKVKMIKEIYEEWFKNYNGETNIDVEIYYATKSQHVDKIKVNKSFKIQEEKIEKILKENKYNFDKLNYIGLDEIDSLIKRKTKKTKELECLLHFSCEDAFDEKQKRKDGHILLVDAIRFYEFIKNEEGNIEEELFEENIRDFQGFEKNGINNKIRDTILSEEKSYERFWCYNNGITIICDFAKTPNKRNGSTFTLTNPQIINGCQTSHSLFEALSEIRKDKDRMKKMKFELIVKVIVIDPEKEQEVIDIISSVNSQTKIDESAFESYKKVHRNIEEYFKEYTPIKYYYERKQGFYKRKDIEKDKIVTPKQLLQEFCSIYHKIPSYARNSIGGVFESYKGRVFNEKNNLGYYFICHYFYTKTVEYIEKYKLTNLEIEDTQEFIINNLDLHLARVLFTLMIGKEFDVARILETKEMKKRLGIDVSEVITKGSESIEINFEKSLNIISTSIQICKKRDPKKETTNLIKTKDFDNEITRVIHEFLSNDFKCEENIEIKKENNSEIKKEWKKMMYILKKIERDGDYRYNFEKNVQNNLDFLSYHFNYQNNINDEYEEIKNICIKEYKNKNDRSLRKQNASDVNKILKEIELKEGLCV